MKFAATLGLVLAFGLCVAWAAVNYYSESQMVQEGDGGSFTLINDGNDRIIVTAANGSLDGYMADEQISELDVTVELLEELIEPDDGTSFYELTFVVSPGGADFSTPLQLTLTGEYASPDTAVSFYDEDGEALEFTRQDNVGFISLGLGGGYTPNSSYFYDDYDY